MLQIIAYVNIHFAALPAGRGAETPETVVFVRIVPTTF
jgi:hypothetical protein